MPHTLTYDEIVHGLDDLPALPAAVLALLRSVDDEDIDLPVLAEKVSHDPALTAKTLRLANSSLYGLQVKVGTVQQAITYLGFGATRSLIKAVAVTRCFGARSCAGFNHAAFWRHAIASAICAKALARQVRFHQDYAFTAGLLHDIGRLVLVSCFPRHYEAVLAWRARHDTVLLEAERAVLGIDHVEAGLALAEHWQFSDTLRLAIGGHHAPEQAGASFLATIVHVADAIAHALDLAQVDEELVPPLSEAAWNALRLDDAVCHQLFREVESQYEEIAAVLLP
jgi:putative nucleotidyltransferase with HDIG domain